MHNSVRSHPKHILLHTAFVSVSGDSSASVVCACISDRLWVGLVTRHSCFVHLCASIKQH